MDIKKPSDAFRSFLDRAEEDGWIAGYKWYSSESFVLLKDKMGPPKEDHIRASKRGTDGVWWVCDIEPHYGTSIGADLEILLPRPILDQPERILNRLGMSRGAAPKVIIEEWSARNAAFKALAPDNSRVLLSQFRRTAPGTYTVYTPQGDRSVQVRTMWSTKWVFCLAWRSQT